MPDMNDLLYGLNRLADEISEHGKYPVRGYAWINQSSCTTGKAVYRTDAQLRDNPRGQIHNNPAIDLRPWSQRKHDKLTASLNRLRERGYLVTEINRPAKEETT